ncbi:MAG: histidinol-phosphate aminotransferase family protein [Nitrososphaera sp.]|jgi:threonine-phosphate decarboxylase
MGQETVSERMGSCSHGGIYSVNPALVRVDCSSSVNPLGTPRKAIDAIQRNAKSLAPMYPDPECRELKDALSSYLHVDRDWISVGNGAVEIIYWFAQAFAKGKVVIPAPTFCEYELASQKAGARVTFVTLQDCFKLDADEIIEKAKGADAIFLCNPNNPTGTLATSEIKRIIENVDSSAKILLDECFIELVDDPDANSMVRRVQEFDNLVILRSLTKSFGLAGLRVGYSVCNPSLAGKLSMNKIPWNVNGLAQAAAVAALSDRKKYLQRTRAVIKRERKFLRDHIARLESFNPLESDVNYFLIDLKDRNSAQFRDALLKKSGVLVRDCSTFTGMGSHHVRVAVKTHAENLRLVKALERFADG